MSAGDIPHADDSVIPEMVGAGQLCDDPIRLLVMYGQQRQPITVMPLGGSVASLDFDKEKNEFREFYSDNHDLLNDATKFFESLVASLASSIPDIEQPTVISRLKDREESIKKFSLKYQTELESTKTEYSIKDHITDLIGVRIICFYETDIAKITKALKDNFVLLEETNKSAEIEKHENTFGYKGHHLDVKINDERSKLQEYKRYKDMRFEVQVRSIIQDAWSVLDHKIKYKKSIPPNLKRQINALAALFEIADREFTQIRETTNSLEKGQIENIETGEPKFDVFAFLSVANEAYPGYQFHGFKADGFSQEILRWKNDITAKEFQDVIINNRAKIDEYAAYQKADHGNSLNAFTQIRHMLYLYDKEKFSLVLYENQRESFEKWLATKA